MRSRSITLRTAAATVVGLVVLGVGASSAPVAWAHASLETTTPAANAVLETGPASIVLDFDEDVEAGLSSITLYGVDGVEVPVGDAGSGADASIIEFTVDGGPTLADGPYAVVWRTTSADGPAVDGSFAFQVGTAATSPDELLDTVDTGGGHRSSEWVLAVGRFLSLLGALVLVGGSWWATRRGAALARQRSTSVVLAVASWTVLVGSVVTVAAFASSVDAGLDSVVQSSTGRMLVLRAALSLMLLVMGARRWPAMRAVLMVLLLVTFSASGHPNVLDPWPLWIVIDVLHLAGVAAWFGGLAVLVALRAEGRAARAAAGVARPFSSVAPGAVPAVVVAGFTIVPVVT
ncbi:MAG: copper resistance protein CopC, partial [Ilumatobacteraceae bacterium]